MVHTPVLGNPTRTHSGTPATSLPHSQMGWMCIPTKAPRVQKLHRGARMAQDLGSHWNLDFADTRNQEAGMVPIFKSTHLEGGEFMPCSEL